MVIDNKRKYSLKEVFSNELIPGVTTYSTLYNLVSYPATENQENNQIRNLYKETTKTSLRASHEGNPWKRIAGKIMIFGADIIKFKELNNLL
jgi:CRISPR/Cas system CSM-associated protein Csm2 small subunit